MTPSSSWSDDEIETIIRSLLLALILSLILWWFFGPKQAPNPPQQQQQQQTQTQPLSSQRTNNTNNTPRSTSNHNHNNTSSSSSSSNDDGIVAMLAKNIRRPSHTTESYHGTVVHDGVVPFRFTKMSVYEARSYSGDGGGGGVEGTTTTTARQMANRKERARLFTKLFSTTRIETTTLTRPPTRGSDVVLTVPYSEASCSKLRRVLFLLGTYYNLFVLVALEPNDTDDDDDGNGEGETETKRYERFVTIAKRTEALLRLGTSSSSNTSNTNTTNDDDDDNNDASLPHDVVPSHRIVPTTSVGGRIAFVRQLPKRPAFVLEYDSEVMEQLMRFGFVVLGYERWDGSGGGNGSSGIGKELLS